MKPKRTYAATIKAPATLDLCQTPPYAVAPLLWFASRKSVIWEPACGSGILANALRVAGYQVIESDISMGQDFFEYEPQRWDIIVTNPPYGIKPAWLERCYELGKPFALLMPTEFQATGQAIDLFLEYSSIQIMNLTPRVDFKMPKEGWFSSAQFPVSWYCSGLLPERLMFVYIYKPPRTVNKQVMRKGKEVTVRGYADWIERPAGFDWVQHTFEYEEWQE